MVRESERVKPGDPSSIGPYRVLRRLGQGGMGTVHLVEDPATGATRALKTLSPGADVEARRRFRREAEAMARVDEHPHVLRVHAAGEHGGAPYLVMDHAPNGDLGARLRDGPLSPDEVIDLGVALARGLEHVHSRGVLHRDLKPSNVLFDDRGAPRLVDFGLARLVGEERLTETGTILGTPAYMAPEQANGAAELDARADVYGLGALLYHALTGRPPFEGTSAWQVIDRVLREPPAPIRQAAPHVPTALEAVVLRALAKAPGDRFSSAGALAGALATAARATPRSPSPWVVAALTLTVMSAAALAALASGLRGDDPPVEPTPSTVPVSATNDRSPPERGPARLDATTALDLLACERVDELLRLAGDQLPRGRDDPLGPIVAAAASLAGQPDGPTGWAAIVETERAKPRPLVGDLRRASDELDTALVGVSFADVAGQFSAARGAVKRAAAARSAAGADPFALAAAIELQRQLAKELVRVVELAMGKTDRLRAPAGALLEEAVALAPRSVAAVVLETGSCLVWISARYSQKRAAWSRLDRRQQDAARLEAAEARAPFHGALGRALWLAYAPPELACGRWDEVEARWRGLEGLEGGRLAPWQQGALERVLELSVERRSHAALWRAWERRGLAGFEAAAADALEATAAVGERDEGSRRLHVARLQLLRGDVAAVTSTLVSIDVVVREDTRRSWAALMLIDGDLLHERSAEALAALETLERGTSGRVVRDPGFHTRRALALSSLGRAPDAALAAARDREPALLDADGMYLCPWWSCEETEAAIRAAGDAPGGTRLFAPARR